MHSRYQLTKQTLVIRIGNELDHHTADRIRQESEEYICKNNVNRIVFDFGGTSFMDSSGIGIIMGRYKVLRALGGKVAVANMSQSIAKIFSMSGLQKIVSYYETLEDALKAE